MSDLAYAINHVYLYNFTDNNMKYFITSLRCKSNFWKQFPMISCLKPNNEEYAFWYKPLNAISIDCKY